MVESIPSLIATIEAHLSGDIADWYIGLTDDPELCPLPRDVNQESECAWWQALTSEEAHSVQQMLIERGASGEEVPHQDTNLYVYAHRR